MSATQRGVKDRLAVTSRLSKPMSATRFGASFERPVRRLRSAPSGTTGIDTAASQLLIGLFQAS